MSDDPERPKSGWEPSWLAFTDGEYYHRCRAIMLKYGMGEGDVEMILANFWENGWMHGAHFAERKDQ